MTTAEKGTRGLSEVGYGLEYRPEDFMIAILQRRIMGLSEEAKEDLISVLSDIRECSSEDELREIHRTVREILFPEAIGKVVRGPMGPASGTPKLEARKDWIAKRIKEIRKERHITQAELAGTSGLPQSHISRLEAGLHSPSFKTVEKIAKALGVEVGEIDPAND